MAASLHIAFNQTVVFQVLVLICLSSCSSIYRQLCKDLKDRTYYYIIFTFLKIRDISRKKGFWQVTWLHVASRRFVYPEAQSEICTTFLSLSKAALVKSLYLGFHILCDLYPVGLFTVARFPRCMSYFPYIMCIYVLRQFKLMYPGKLTYHYARKCYGCW